MKQINLCKPQLFLNDLSQISSFNLKTAWAFSIILSDRTIIKFVIDFRNILSVRKINRTNFKVEMTKSRYHTFLRNTLILYIYMSVIYYVRLLKQTVGPL